MLRTMLRKLLSGAAAVMTAAGVLPAMPVQITATDPADAQDDLKHMCISLSPDGAADDRSVTLEGLMPQNASAEAVNVSEDYAAFDARTAEMYTAAPEDAALLAAYDITISDGRSEYQPDASRPILVEIVHPDIIADRLPELWHITDDGHAEQITDFDITDGKISFYATGFSVYAIVEPPAPFNPALTYAEDVPALYGTDAASGLYLEVNGQFFRNTLNNNGAFLRTANLSEAAPFFIETRGGDYYIYTYVDGEKQYITNSDTADLRKAGLGAEGCAFEITEDPAADNNFYFKVKDANRWLQYSGTGKGFRFYTDNNNAANSHIRGVFVSSVVMPDDYYHLDGRSFGLMNYTNGLYGNSMLADPKDGTAMNAVEMTAKIDPVSHQDLRMITVDGDISNWTFHIVSQNQYLISAETDSGTKYLSIGANGLSLCDAADAQPVTVTVGTGNQSGKIKLSTGSYAVSYEGANGFKTAANNNDAKLWLNLTERAPLNDDDFVTYSAQKVSISDVPNGQDVIVYTRIWDDDEKRYHFYAIDHDGSLVPCYERGDSIQWVGTQVNTLLWDFTEYYREGTTTPNYYYELFNPYSGQYLAPQIENNQILSDSKIGINLPGRRERKYYSEIFAWDDDYYTYAGVKGNLTNGEVESCPRPYADTFYFASIESETPELTPVNTIDHKSFGITMKMVDFPSREYQKAVIGHDNTDVTLKQGLLSTDLVDGYPTAVNSLDGAQHSLSELFANATEVNHLFIDSIYRSSGYFEFDSCQNFATLIKEDGTTGTDFTVYKELGTTDNSGKTTLSHGQFFPYDTITAGVYSTVNPLNTHSALANTKDTSAGMLPASDPRRYERLLTVGSNPNYYNGMELDASFVQTPNGKDMWGHDIIFEFTGDDDFWLYVDNELVIDLGGIHSALAGSVNFSTGEVVVDGKKTTLREVFKNNYLARNPSASAADVNTELAKYFDPGSEVFKTYSKHTMKIFYMERGAGASNLHMRFNLSYVTPGHVLLKKNVTGSNDLDFSLVEYPYQIWYKVKNSDTPHLLTSTDQLINVTYQNSPQTVSYAPHYSPPGSDLEYDSVYFLSPDKVAEIHFPSDLISYRIVECSINTEVYDSVKINDTAVSGTARTANRKDYDTGWVEVQNRISVEYENHVNPEGLRTLTIRKQLYDAAGTMLTAAQDPTEFTFRLSLSQHENSAPVYANMVKYYVKDPSGKLCKWNHETQQFEPTSASVITTLTTAQQKNEVTFETSMNGTISRIPAGYRVEVPNLPVGTKFIVEEEDATIPKGYKRIGYERDQGSFYNESDGDTYNSGRIRANESPSMAINNRRGWELEAQKIWSDADTMQSHGDIYTAVYVNGALLPGTVRQIASPKTSARYYFDALQTGSTFDQYEIREVKLTNPVTDANGNVTAYASITPLESGDMLTVSAVPNGTSTAENFNYHVYPHKGTVTGGGSNVRTDTVTNTPEGGIQLRLFQWDSALPLAGGVFALTDQDGNVIGAEQYTSDENGVITILCNPAPGMTYTLTQTAAPQGYIGLKEPLTFTLDADKNVTVNNADCPGWADAFKPDSTHEFLGFIDIHNKPFLLQAIKLDGSTNEPLEGVHFALYKSVKNNQGVYVKDYVPLSGYGDLATNAAGVIPKITNALAPGRYYLTETVPQTGYAPLCADIVFTVSERGTVTLESGSASLQTSESGGISAYTITVRNSPADADVHLTLTKQVTGAFGSRVRQFTFTLQVEGAAPDAAYTWTKNGTEQPEPLHPDSSFTLAHDDTVTITLPPHVHVTVTEDNSGYSTTFAQDDTESVSGSSLMLVTDADTAVTVTNSRTGILPTGVQKHPLRTGFLLLLLLAAAGILLRRRQNRQHT